LDVVGVVGSAGVVGELGEVVGCSGALVVGVGDGASVVGEGDGASVVGEGDGASVVGVGDGASVADVEGDGAGAESLVVSEGVVAGGDGASEVLVTVGAGNVVVGAVVDVTVCGLGGAAVVALLSCRLANSTRLVATSSFSLCTASSAFLSSSNTPCLYFPFKCVCKMSCRWPGSIESSSVWNLDKSSAGGGAGSLRRAMLFVVAEKAPIAKIVTRRIATNRF
jgi:hypothetical protein